MVFPRRLRLLMLVAVVGSAAIWLRVAWLQVVQSDAWHAAARRARLSSLPQQARRGTLVDADGKLLVQDQPVFELVLVPGEWASRERYRCEGCGVLHYGRAGVGPPRRTRCCTAPERHLVALGPGDLKPLETALGLPYGMLEARARLRQAEIDEQVADFDRRIKEADDLDDDDFMVKERVAAFREARESVPVVLVSEVDLPVERLVGLDEAGVTRGLRLRPAHVRRAAGAGPLARVLGEAALPDAEDVRVARREGRTLALDVLEGKTGLEATYDDELRGTPGWELRARGGEDAEVAESSAPIPGATLHLSVSGEACRMAQEALASLPELVASYAPRTQPSGALIAMRADTGEVVALAELPEWVPPEKRPVWSQDGETVTVLALPDREQRDWVPARRRVGAPRTEDEQRRAIEQSSGFARVLLPWRVRANVVEPWEPSGEGFDRTRWRATLAAPAGEHLSRVSQVAVEPGSTMKAFIGLAMLEGGLPLPIAGHFACEGRNGVPGCHNHPPVDFEEALEHSCNQYFATSLREFSSHWPRYRTSVGAFIDRLGFGRSTGSDLRGEARGTWLRREPWGPGELPTIPRDSGVMVAIGQGEVTATPLQMVRAVACLANGGRLVTPHLVRQVVAADGSVRAVSPQSVDLGIDPASIARVREGMRRVVYGDAGTARRSADWDRIPARIFAKTGTSQVPPAWRPFHPGAVSREVTHQWFVGFAEADGQPPLAFAVVYHARLETAAGATAAKTGARFLEAWFQR